MAKRLERRYVLGYAMLVLCACGRGPGSGQDTVRSDAANNFGSDDIMDQVDQDRRMDYVEFLTTDIGETKKFYAEVFGWEFTDYGPEYTSFSDGRLNGGFALAGKVTRGGPLVVIYAIDLADIESRVRENDGTIVRDMFEFPGGRRFHFTDPGGNELAVWSDQ